YLSPRFTAAAWRTGTRAASCPGPSRTTIRSTLALWPAAAGSRKRTGCMKNRSVSVTGATGFLGWHIATELAARGWTVRAIVRPGSAKPLPEGVEIRQSSLEHVALKAAFDGSDVVVHAAGLTRARSERAFRTVH